MKNLKKYAAITFVTLMVGLLTISVTNTPHNNYRGFERPVRVEKWMTQPFTDFYEEPLEVEDWMTKPFITN